MKPGLEVLWTEAAAADLERIVASSSAETGRNAQRVLAKLERAASSLAHLPRRGRGLPELLRIEVTTYRELQVPPWRIIYRPGRGRVMIMAVLDGRRDLELALLGRLTSKS